jgi:hypothetical protein
LTVSLHEFLKRTALGRSRAYSVRNWGAILAGVKIRRAVTRQSPVSSIPITRSNFS